MWWQIAAGIFVGESMVAVGGIIAAALANWWDS